MRADIKQRSEEYWSVWDCAADLTGVLCNISAATHVDLYVCAHIGDGNNQVLLFDILSYSDRIKLPVCA